MRKKRYRPEEIISKLREADILLGQGHAVAQVIKSIEISDVTYYRWRKERLWLNDGSCVRKCPEYKNHICVNCTVDMLNRNKKAKSKDVGKYVNFRLFLS